MRIHPFRALHPPTETAHIVSCPPYDTMNTDEAREMAEGNPRSFLRVIRPEINFDDGKDIYSDDVYTCAAETLANMEATGILERDTLPCFYVYRQKMGEHTQRGLVACCHVDDYDNDLVRKHEKTREAKERDRARHVLTLKANTGPVFLTYKDRPEIDTIIEDIESSEPLFDFTAPDGVVHTVWRVPEEASGLTAAFADVDLTYIADGHHRAAAAARAARELRDAEADPESQWFMTVLFPASQLQILPYHRVVDDLNGLTPTAFLEAVKGVCRVTEGAQPEPASPGQASMYLGGQWYGLSWDPITSDDPVASLDVSVLQERVLAPILGIDDPRTNPRIDFVGGIRGPQELVRRVDEGAAVAFALYPVTVEQMIAIADAGEIMPPKSTWFEPKLRSGLLVHKLTDQ